MTVALVLEGRSGESSPSLHPAGNGMGSIDDEFGMLTDGVEIRDNASGPSLGVLPE